MFSTSREKLKDKSANRGGDGGRGGGGGEREMKVEAKQGLNFGGRTDEIDGTKNLPSRIHEGTTPQGKHLRKRGWRTGCLVYLMMPGNLVARVVETCRWGRGRRLEPKVQGAVKRLCAETGTVKPLETDPLEVSRRRRNITGPKESPIEAEPRRMKKY